MQNELHVEATAWEAIAHKVKSHNNIEKLQAYTIGKICLRSRGPQGQLTPKAMPADKRPNHILTTSRNAPSTEKLDLINILEKNY